LDVNKSNNNITEEKKNVEIEEVKERKLTSSLHNNIFNARKTLGKTHTKNEIIKLRDEKVDNNLHI